jgi:hypothetical protein
MPVWYACAAMGPNLPGVVIHVLGDLARVYFGVLQGDGGRLFAN